MVTQDLFDDAEGEPGTVPGQPPSTLAEVRRLLMEHEVQTPRSLQKTLGPSELGTPCDRQIALKLAGAPRNREDGVKWAPWQGTVMHAGMADLLDWDNGRTPIPFPSHPRYLIEQRVHLDDEISGTGDAYDRDTGTVIDWKYVGITTIRDARRGRVKQEYQDQPQLYGMGFENAGFEVKWVRLVFLARTHNFEDSFEWTAPYDRRIAQRVLDRFYRVRNDLESGAVPAHMMPVSETACTWCPFAGNACELGG